ncbi:MAG: hypothetical protein IJ874_03650 [Ruminococcus sp.]|nr:hypothetical protein [Ruminococcus sp.]
MKQDNLSRLRKRASAEMWFSGIISVLALVIGILCLVKLSDNAAKQYLTNAVYSFTIAAELLILSCIFADIRKNGKPFARAVINRLRIMSIILLIAGNMPNYIEIPVSDTSKAIVTSFNLQNMLMIVVALIILLISEIFVYGRKLQEDNDLIA